MTVDAYEAHTETLPAQAPASSPARLVITGTCDGFAELRGQLADHPEVDVRGWCEEIGEAAGLLAASPAAVVHATRDWHGVYGELAAIREHTGAPIVLVAPEGSDVPPSFADLTVDVLLLPQPAEAVVTAVRRAHGGQESQRRSEHARVLTVFSPKGGTGKSVIASNLAVALAGKDTRTLLLDLQLERGDAALMLGLDPGRTIYDLVVAPGDLDAAKLTGYTTAHESGLHVLPAPLRPEQAELVGEADVARVLELAAATYDAVVVDSPASFDGALLAALDVTDALLLVCELDTATLKNVRIALETLELLKFPAEHVSLVLNRTGPATSIKRSELEAALGTRVRFEVPYDADVPTAVGRGTPRVLARGDFSRVVAKVAWELGPRPGSAGKPAAAPAATNGNGTGRRGWLGLRRR